MNNIRKTNVFLTQGIVYLTHVYVRIKQKKFACNHSKASAFFTTCLCFLDLCIELALSRNPANNSLLLYFSSDLSSHSCLRTRSDQGRFPVHTLEKLPPLAARFFIYYISTNSNGTLVASRNRRRKPGRGFYREETLY